MRKHLLYILLAAPLALAACGETTSDRAISGAGIGAAAGTAGAALTGGSLATGAVIGAAAGGAGGALTDSSDIDLGTPWWKNW